MKAILAPIALSVMLSLPVTAAITSVPLEDVNSASSSFGSTISPSDYAGGVSAWYFAKANWSYCRSQFGYLSTLQDSLNLEYPALQIDILGVNEFGAGGQSQMPSSGSIPWLQDTDTDNNSLSDLQAAMGAGYRDVIIVDSELEIVGSYNLTTYNLSNSSNFDNLKSLLVEAATPAPEPSSVLLVALSGVLCVLRRRRGK